MKGKKYALNVDRLEVCYVAPREVVDNIEDTTLWEREGYRLTEVERNKVETVLRVDIQVPEEEEPLTYAWIRIGSKFEKEEDVTRYVWIRLENKALYTQGVGYLYFIADDLGLQFNNITDIEIAIDSNINWFRRVRAALRSEELVPVVLGKVYKDRKKVIDNVFYLHTGNRERYKTNTLIVKSGDGEMSLKVYDKGAEIVESGKDYIRESFGLTSRGFYRTEVKVFNKALKEFCTAFSLSQYDIYMRLVGKEIVFDLFLFFSDRLLRFRDKREKVSLMQL